MPSIYIENEEVRNTNDYGVYFGSTPCKQVYYGSNLVYQFESYIPSSEITYSTPNSYSAVLPIGVYKIAVCGAKGNSVTWAYGGYPWGAQGGSGGFVELTFYNPKAQNIQINAGNSGNATISLGNNTVITARCGGNAGVNSGGAGGTVTVSGLDILSIQRQVQGNNGGVAPYSPPDVASVSTYGSWGSSANPAGGARLEYIRYEREV